MKEVEARRIAQEFLDLQGEATISGNVDATLDWCDIPCTLESMEGQTVATNTAEMRAICTTFIDSLRARRLTCMARRCLEAKFKDADTIWATYETRYVQDNQHLIEDPYAGFVILRRRGDRWKISTMQFAVSGTSPANLTLRGRSVTD
jgi:hypothetical protein